MSLRRWKMVMYPVSLVVLVAALSGEIACAAPGTDWPTHHYDNRRSAVSPMQLADELHLQWTHQSPHAPMPAWPEPLREFHRQPFDYAYQMVSAGGLLLYGSSADHKLYALDVESGKVRWTFFTEGPIRFSPAIYDGRVYLASDDGFLYCLRLDTGYLVWKCRVGPEDDLVVGNDRVISRWPLRSGAMVNRGIVYVTAGMWNVDGVYIMALDAKTGEIVWQNDTANHIYLVATHGEEGIVNVPPQGYLLENEGTLVVPTGRGPPAGFDLATGKFLWYQVEFGKPHHAGSSYAFVNGGMVFTLDRKCNAGVAPLPYRNTDDEYFHGWTQGLMAWDTSTGNDRMCVADVQRAVADGATIFCVNENKLVSADFAKLKEVCWDLRGVTESDTEQLGANAGWMKKFGIVPAQSKLNAIFTTGKTKWETKSPGRVYDMIAAGDKLYLATRERLSAYNRHTGEKVFENKIEGRVRGIIAAGGRLFAGTDRGTIYCFGPEEVAPPSSSSERVRKGSIASGKLARAVLSSTGIDAGRALLLGSDVALAAGLSKNSRLAVSCFDHERARMLATRNELDAMGLYGVAIALHHGQYADLPYTDHFANLVVATERLGVSELKELYRVLRPYGGKAYLACDSVSVAQWRSLLAEAGVPTGDIRATGGALIIEKGPLDGAGSWTHQCADARNSYSSGDSIVRAPLKLQWWGGPGPASAVNRHQYGPNPIAASGRFFMTGRHTITCGDIYNGFVYWTFHYPNIGRIGAKYWGGGQITDGETVYVASGDSCLLIDAKTGRLKNVFEVPVLKQRHSIATAKSFSVEGDRQTSGRVTLRKTPNGLAVELARRDDHLVEHDGWDLFFDFRPSHKREILYTHGAFRLHVVETAGGPRAVAAGYTKCSAFRTTGGNTPDGSRITITFPWNVLKVLTGSSVGEFRFGFAMVTAPVDKNNAPVTPEEKQDPRVRKFQKAFLLAQSYNERLTCGLGEFTLGKGGKIGGEGFYDSAADEAFTWNYSALSDGLLFGSASRQIHFEWHGRPAPNPADEFIFAMDKTTGRMKWLIEAEESFSPLFIGIDEKHIYFVDKENFGKMAAKDRRGMEARPVKVKAADKFTGKIVWETADVAFLGKQRLQVAGDVVLLSSGDSGIVGISKADGRIAWHNEEVKSAKPPVLIKDRIYWKPNQFDLRTGQKTVATNPITGQERSWQFHTEGRGGCGEMSGCDNAVFFRDGYLAYHDLVADDGEHWVGGIRPSCAANILPVGGLVVQPEGSSGCTCAGFSFQTCIALAPASKRQEVWTVLKGNASGLEDIADLKLNFGAPGDRRLDDQWYLAFPRDFRPSYQRLPVVAGDKDVTFFRRNADQTDIQGTEMDWFYGSQAGNIRRLHIDLVLNLPVVATRAATPPAIDGRPNTRLADACNLIRFCDSEKRIYRGASAALSYDDDNLYVTLKREAVVKDGKLVPWSAETEGENALTWKDDSWSIRLDGGGMVSFDVSASGARRVDVYKSLVKNLKWHWKSAVYISPETGTWTTEVAIPWADLEKHAGIERDSGCSVYIQGINRTGVGPDRFQYKYRDQEKHKIHCGTAPLAFDALPAQEEKHYKMLLHFAELDEVAPGERVFDVRVQGKTLIEGLDIVKEAGGPLKPLTREVSDISGSTLLEVEFVPHEGSLPPVISGLELIRK
jgi:outer membrane protein assembly factor BamB